MALKPPVEVPQGAIRLNTDSQKLEFFAQDQWWRMATDVPTLSGGVRGVIGGGAASNVIQYVTLSTAGNAADFGDLTTNTYLSSCSSSRTRGVWNGGYTNTPSGTYINVIQYVTIASTGNAADFGDLTQVAGYSGSCSSATRGVRAGGTAPANPSTDTIDYYTIASTGNAVDFGNLTSGTAYNSDGTVNSPTRGMWIAGGPGNSNTIDYITIATTGNASDFGDATLARTDACGVCSSVRGIWGGGYNSGEKSTIDYITIASLGNASDFGDMTISARRYAACSAPTRGLWAGGSAPSASDVMDYITIQTAGDAVDFGNLVGAQYECAGLSNGHGGL